jgi:hypothetical protein
MRQFVGSFIAAAAVLLTAAPAAHAQTATILGSIGNFDIVNNAGQDAHGFEIQLEGVQPADVYYAFSGQRYGAPEIVPYATGVYVRWMSPYDTTAGQFLQTTIAFAPGTPFVQGMCYMWNGPSYDTAGCEHFGVSLLRNAGATTFRWLIADPVNLGALNTVTLGTPVAAPVYYIVPPAIVGNPPQLVAEVIAPEPADAPDQFGDAQWMKVFKTELGRQVGLDELLGDNPIVPQDPAQLEVSWEVVQTSPATVNGKRNRTRTRNQGGLSATTRAVLRRYEMYAYTGVYDPLTHEALCADLACNAPSADELGDFISAQMTAANVAVPSITLSKGGNGSVTASDKSISCGSLCTAFYNAGTAVTLTASSSSGSVFKSWSGDCTGGVPTCTVIVNDQSTIGATFVPLFTLSVGRSNPGTITGSPAGTDRALNCGSNCSAKFASGTLVTLTATPPAGKQFVNWTGSGAGECALSTVPTCNVLISKDTSVQANFSK